MGIEIERKWLVKDFPKRLKPDEVYMISQWYLSCDNIECRLRESIAAQGFPDRMSHYKMTVKSDGNVIRKEVEIELTPAQYNEFLDLLGERKPIIKEYHKYIIDGKTVEISEVDNDWFYAEVEFSKTGIAFDTYKFPWPEIVIREVTNDCEYKMKRYWKRTRGKVSV